MLSSQGSSQALMFLCIIPFTVVNDSLDANHLSQCGAHAQCFKDNRYLKEPYPQGSEFKWQTTEAFSVYQ